MKKALIGRSQTYRSQTYRSQTYRSRTYRSQTYGSKTLCSEAGVTMILVAVCMVAIVAMAALSIDVVTLYLARMEAQRTADAAALAAARVISISGITGDSTTDTTSWQAICGTTGVATQAAKAAAAQAVDNAAPTVTVAYSAQGSPSGVPDCSTALTQAFAINPTVIVQVTRNNLPTFFSHMWGNTGSSTSATAIAEAFNPSNSASIAPGGEIIPVQPRCVKPWIVPNADPLHPAPVSGTYCNDGSNPGACNRLVDAGTGQIQNPGISLNGTGSSGIIGETFWLGADCTHTGSNCSLRTGGNQPQANFTGNSFVRGPPNLLYVPGQAPASVAALPSCSSGGSAFEQAVAGCDQSTVYACGVSSANTVDLSAPNPATQFGDTATGVQCLIHEGSPTATQPDGQDTIQDSSYPFQFLAGSSSPLVGGSLSNGSPITSSNSIVTVPIYDAGNTISTTGTSQVTIVGFLQVFINQVDSFDNVQVTVLNVSGCGNGTNSTSTNVAPGSSPVPVRLITQ